MELANYSATTAYDRLQLQKEPHPVSFFHQCWSPFRDVLGLGQDLGSGQMTGSHSTGRCCHCAEVWAEYDRPSLVSRYHLRPYLLAASNWPVSASSYRSVA